MNNFDDENEIRQVYYPEMEQLVKETTGAARVIAFDHNLRNDQKLKQGVKEIQGLVKQIHIDIRQLLILLVTNGDRVQILETQLPLYDPPMKPK
jgi:DhnA family fructose-bisphosphate aldolase class Ia